MKRLLALVLAVVALTGCSTQQPAPAPSAPTRVGYYHDPVHHVACWTFGYGYTSAAIDCLPDSQVTEP